MLNRSPREAWDETDCPQMLRIVGKSDTAENRAEYCGFFSKEPMLADDDKLRGEIQCHTIRSLGSQVGIATVGSDDKVAVSFEVTVPTFKAGDQNYICMIDGEARMSSRDIEQFELEPSIRVSPSSVAVGDTVTVFAQDFMANDHAAENEPVELANQEIRSSSGDIGDDGSGTVTFEVPGWAEGTLRVDAWGEDTKLTVTSSGLTLSKTEALPNEPDHHHR